jgi:hypothetical protein
VHRRLAVWHRIVLEAAAEDAAMRAASIAEQDARRAAARWQVLADADRDPQSFEGKSIR